jgi:hypothetical protein
MQTGVTPARHFAAVPRYLLHGLGLALILTPLLATGGLYLTDLPNHIFRMQVIADLVAGKGSSFYDLHFTLIPNLPLDLATILFGRYVAPEHIAVALTCLACAAFYGAIVYWRHSEGRPTSVWLWAVIVLSVFSYPLASGLTNYILGLAIMLLALMRLDRVGARPSAGFCLAQAALVVALYFCSVFPVLLYFVWAAGTGAYDLIVRRANVVSTIVRNAALHLVPLVTIAVLILVANPLPPIATETSWSLGRKLAALLSVGRMSNLPQEFVFPGLLLGAIALRATAGALRVDGRHAAGLLSLVACFLAMPSMLQGAGLADVRLSMGISAVLTAVAREEPGFRPRLAVVSGVLVGLVLVLRPVSLAAAWLPLQFTVAPAYKELADRVRPGSAVLFVLDGQSGSERTQRIAEAWKAFVHSGSPAPVDDPTAFANVWHLHMYYLRGKDLFLSEFFPNFSIRQKPALPFHADYTRRPPIAELISQDPYDYVLTHADLGALPLVGKTLCPEAESGGVRLYRVAAGPSCANS